MPRSVEDLHEVLRMYNQVTQRLQVSHERLEQEVVRLREQLEQKDKELELKKRLAALGEMAAGIAHEIRNPLGGIQLYASTLAGEVRDRPMASELVKKISNGVNGLNALVCDMLAFTGNMILDRREQALCDIVDGAVELARPVLSRHGVAVCVDRSVAGVSVTVDGRLLQRVILNLVLNAGEAIAEKPEARSPKPGGGSRNQEGLITISCEQNDAQTAIIVEDDGPGIPEEVLERIFNPFFTTKHSGTGLGLAIVHRIVEAHGGTIHAENRRAPQRGARFRIELGERQPK
jgi:signal transduction histidine kinase